MGWMALSDEDGNDIGTTGDEGWDLATDFVATLKEIYLKAWGRNPTIEEVLSTVEFVFDSVMEDIEE